MNEIVWSNSIFTSVLTTPRLWPFGDCEEELRLPTANQQVTDRLRKKKNCGKHEQLTWHNIPVRDFVAIAELKILDHREHDRVVRDHAGSVKELEATGHQPVTSEWSSEWWPMMDSCYVFERSTTFINSWNFLIFP